MKAVVIDGFGESDRLQVREVAAPGADGRRGPGPRPRRRGGSPGRLEDPPGNAPAGPPAAVPVRARVRHCGRGRAGRAGRRAVPARRCGLRFLEPGFGRRLRRVRGRQGDPRGLEAEFTQFPRGGRAAGRGPHGVQALRDLGRLRPGGWPLVHRAAGGVGHLAVQVAGRCGARVAGTCGPCNVAFVRGLGTDPVLDSTRDDFTRRGETYDVVLDAVAKSTFGACRRALRPGHVRHDPPSLGVFFWGAVLPAARLLGDGERAKFLLVRPSGPDLELLGRFADADEVRPSLTRTSRSTAPGSARGERGGPHPARGGPRDRVSLEGRGRGQRAKGRERRSEG